MSDANSKICIIQHTMDQWAEWHTMANGKNPKYYVVLGNFSFNSVLFNEFKNLNCIIIISANMTNNNNNPNLLLKYHEFVHYNHYCIPYKTINYFEKNLRWCCLLSIWPKYFFATYDNWLCSSVVMCRTWIESQWGPHSELTSSYFDWLSVN